MQLLVVLAGRASIHLIGSTYQENFNTSLEVNLPVFVCAEEGLFLVVLKISGPSGLNYLSSAMGNGTCIIVMDITFCNDYKYPVKANCNFFAICANLNEVLVCCRLLLRISPILRISEFLPFSLPPVSPSLSSSQIGRAAGRERG